MKCNYSTLKKNVNDIKDAINFGEGNEVKIAAQIQKIYSSADCIFMQIRAKGKSQFIVIGRGRNYQGIYLSTKNIKSEFRVRDAFLEYLRSSLTGKFISDIKIDESDRIVHLFYGRGNQMVFFWCSNTLKFFDYYHTDNGVELFSYDHKKHKISSDIEIENLLYEYGKRKLETFVVQDSCFDVEVYEKTMLDQQNIDLKKEENKKLKFLKKKKSNIEGDLIKLNDLENIQIKLIDGDVDFGTGIKVKINESIFKVNPSDSDFKKRDDIFTRIKKMKYGKTVLFKRLEEVDLEIERCTRHEQIHLSKLSFEIVPVIESRKQKMVMATENIATKHDFDIFKFLTSNIKIAIGKTAKGNDELRNQWANKDDLWLHLDGDTSPHIIIKTDNLLTLPPDDLEALAGLMNAYSGLNQSEINIITTQVKNLKGVKGASGKVTYKKEKRIKLICSNKWQELLVAVAV